MQPTLDQFNSARKQVWTGTPGLAISIAVVLFCYWCWLENEASYLDSQDWLAERITTRGVHKTMALVHKDCDAGGSLEACLRFARECLDGWGRPLRADFIAGRLRIASCGRDGEFGTLDDIAADGPFPSVQVGSQRDK